MVQRRHPVNKQLHVANRIPLPKSRLGITESPCRSQSRILTGRKNTRRIRRPTQRTETTPPHGQTHHGKMRRPRLHAKIPCRRKRIRGYRGITHRMERSPTGRRLRPDTAQDTDARQRRATTARREKECSETGPARGRELVMGAIHRIRYGTLLINTEIYQYVQGGRIALDAVRKIRIVGNADPRTGAETIHRNPRRGNGKAQCRTDQRKIEHMFGASAGDAGITKNAI